MQKEILKEINLLIEKLKDKEKKLQLKNYSDFSNEVDLRLTCMTEGQLLEIAIILQKLMNISNQFAEYNNDA